MMGNLYPMFERFGQHCVRHQTRPSRGCRPALTCWRCFCIDAWAQAADPSDIVEGASSFGKRPAANRATAGRATGARWTTKCRMARTCERAHSTGRIWS
jgi:hypothetical protein